MTNREQLIQEFEQAPEDLVQTVINFLHRVKATRQKHPLEKFADFSRDLLRRGGIRNQESGVRRISALFNSSCIGI